LKLAIVPLVAVLLGQGPASGGSAPGDRVVMIGGTLIERDQSHGYLETRWTRRHPDRAIVFRNLGWSGDTVEGPSRARFGSTADGFKHLVEHVEALKPDVIVVGYGANEAFEGAAGVAAFREGLDTLLAALEPLKAHLVLLAPNRQEDMGRPLPDPARHNADLALYRDVLRDAERSRWSKMGDEKRWVQFVDLLDALPDGAKATPRRPLTDNGIHFNAYGYWRMAAEVERATGPAPDPARVVLDAKEVGRAMFPAGSINIRTIGAAEAIPGGFRARLLESYLPAPPPPDGAPGLPVDDRTLSVANLAPGRYTLKVDGRAVASADAGVWAAGVKLTKGPEFDQVEALRAAINAKNELYFHRWRPENETYLFGFRKHEQGRNAAEIVAFDPLIAAKEAEIARLRVPVEHTYELTREGEVGR